MKNNEILIDSNVLICEDDLKKFKKKYGVDIKIIDNLTNIENTIMEENFDINNNQIINEHMEKIQEKSLISNSKDYNQDFYDNNYSTIDDDGTEYYFVNMDNILNEKSQNIKITKNYRKKDPSFGNVVGECVCIPTNENLKQYENKDILVMGDVFDIDYKELRNGSYLYSFRICDPINEVTIVAKNFLSEQKLSEFKCLKDYDKYKVNGKIKYDNYDNSYVLYFETLEKIEKEEIPLDTAKKKRVELHGHTNMSELSGICDLLELVNRAKYYNHKAIAIADTETVQNFPDIQKLLDNDFKMIYGLEIAIVNDEVNFTDINEEENINSNNYVVFDLETTGFSPIDNKIIEIGAVKIKNNVIVDEFSSFINIGNEKLTSTISELTNITDIDLENANPIEIVLPEFLNWCEDCNFVAHNASFDISFLKQKIYDLKLLTDNENQIQNFKNRQFKTLDTLKLSRLLLDIKRYRLDKVAKEVNVLIENHHRAIDDSRTTARILLKLFEKLDDLEIKTIKDLNEYARENFDFTHLPFHTAVILVKNQKGIKDLYKLVSFANIKGLAKNYPVQMMIPKKLIDEYRENLFIISSGKNGELFNYLYKSTNLNSNELKNILSYYDAFEIQSIDCYKNMIGVSNDFKDLDSFKNMVKKTYKLCKKEGKILYASSNPHYLDKSDKIYRDIILNSKGKKDSSIYDFKRTDTMLDEFSFLGKEASYEIVVENTNNISDMIDNNILAIPKGTFPPSIDGCDEDLKKSCYDKAYSIYGIKDENGNLVLPKIVEDRLERELTPIIKNGYGVMYSIAQKLVAKSMNDGYMVGSRGSVGSSFAATMAGITEVNPLLPHYICEKCHYSEFIDDENITSGYDLVDKKCPNCKCNLGKNGHNIPFETFLGFDADKEPDIDLNFAGEYQSVVHTYTNELFPNKVFKAGTISKIKDNTAYGFIKKYYEDNNKEVDKGYMKYLVKGCIDVKRTSGQHPGGIMVVPYDKDVEDFTPVQYPANDKTKSITTHFDYHSISGVILKLDLLGHDVPTQFKILKDLTNVDPMSINLDDKNVMDSILSLFSSTKILQIKNSEYNENLGVIGIPEFGTLFVKKMLEDIKPKRFQDLINVSGLSHGTDVWKNNAQYYLNNNIIDFSQAICTRDDIMRFLINKGVDNKSAFFIMEKVRKGKGLSKEDELEIKNAKNFNSEYKKDGWYIESCNKIKYMFPRAHAVAYVIAAAKIAFYKIYYPKAFYASQFYSKLDFFDSDVIFSGYNAIKEEMERIKSSEKDKNKYVVFELALEMYARGFEFAKVDILKSDAHKFILEGEGLNENQILPPLSSLNNVSSANAISIVEYRESSNGSKKSGEIDNIKNLGKKASLNINALESLRNHGCFKKYKISETNQMDLSSFFK